ncbi:hypothetical protein DPMN_056408 [Dreissena polymorpha]|uniref:Uncharacterized protein n=1 Tax=Dreissena polymorpha TaxID=45954 RepID=A0A9D4HRH3_DREPO|nr:hypothetical protein DPMN_056408 [Dreissena polymorpha]
MAGTKSSRILKILRKCINKGVTQRNNPYDVLPRHGKPHLEYGSNSWIEAMPFHTFPACQASHERNSESS